MLDITPSTVAEAADFIEKSGAEPSVESIREFIGGGSKTKLTPLVRDWKVAREIRRTSSVVINPAIGDLVRVQIVQESAKASDNANSRAKEAEDAFDELAKQMAEIEAQLQSSNASLATARVQLLQQEVQLQERGREIDEQRALRVREIEELRTLSAATIAEADQRAHSEREKAEALRQELVLSNIQLKMVPTLEATVDSTRKLLKASSDDLALAKQSEAVAKSQADAQLKRADEAASREAKLDSQLQQLHAERAHWLGTEREAHKEILRLSNLASVLEARCIAQTVELKRLGQLQQNAGDDASESASLPLNPHRAA